jgi:serine/threonine protein kinase
MAAVDWQIGQRIGARWDMQQILRGGMGIVYIVYDHWSHEQQAAKTFPDSVFARNPQVADRFTEEAKNWVNLDAHDNVVQAKYIEIIGNRPFLFLEYVSGGDLNSWIGSSRLRNNLPQVLLFGIQFCDGMNHILSKGIKAHRDIKPQNCLVASEQTLKLTDFGLAKVLEHIEFDLGAHHSSMASAPDLSRTGGAVGTCTHMAPEQFQDAKHVDVRADVYSFGVMLFQMLVGGLPFTGRTWMEFAEAHATSARPSPTSGDNVLDELVLKCLAKKPSERYQDFHRVRRDLVTIYERRAGQFLGSASVQDLTAQQ